MPASKKDLRAQKQKANIKAGIGDEKGRLPSQTKVVRNYVYYDRLCWQCEIAQDAPVMASCTVCKQQIRMIKKNEQVFLKLRRRNERRERIRVDWK